MWNSQYTSDYLMHHGILGMKWGVRRYQNEDGSLTAEGKKRKSEKIFQSKSTKDAYRRAKENLDIGRRAATLALATYGSRQAKEMIAKSAAYISNMNSKSSAGFWLLIASVPVSILVGKEIYKKTVDLAIYRKEQYEKEHKK